MTSSDTPHPLIVPRHESFDRFFFVLRAAFFIGAVSWVASTMVQVRALPGLADSMLAGVIPPLLWFLLYSLLFLVLIFKVQTRRAVSFHVMMVLDITFVTLMVRATGHGNSEFFLGYYLFIAAQTMAFGMASGAAATVLSSILYMALYFQFPDRFFIGDFAMRTGFMFLVYFVIAALAENERRDRQLMERDQRKIDELNRRLERGMAELMEEKQALNENHLVKIKMLQRQKDMTERRQHHIAFTKEMNAKNTIEETIQVFCRYIGGLLGVDNVYIMAAGADQEYVLYRPKGREIRMKPVSGNHPILETVRQSPDHKAEWRVSAEGQPVPRHAVLVDYEPAVVRAEPLLGGRVNEGVFVISHSEPCRFDPDVMDETRILCNHLGVAIQNLRLRFRLQEMAETDGLTGLYNHRYLQNRLDQEILRAERYGRPLSILLFDIDHFKGFNDTYGHQTGDAVLRELAGLVSERLRKLDVLARYGGEEFMAILPETPLEGARELAERLREAVAAHPFPNNGGDPLTVTVSIGVGSFPEYKEKLELVEATDQALYRAKEGGRNRVES